MTKDDVTQALAKGARDGGAEINRHTSVIGIEQTPWGEWLVRTVSGNATTKTYRCPGCDHEIRPGTPHVVAWPAADYGSVEDRRHWHQGCWSSRTRRGPTTRRW